MTIERIELKTFGRGGVHPSTHKRDTALLPVEAMSPLPPEVWLPLVQHIGEPATPLVKKGDRVVRGQKIADGGATGSPLHATISGKVKPIDKRPHPTLVSVDSIIIARDGEEEQEFPEDPGWRTLSREEMLERIREAGIVGLGGAAFPTYRKLTLPPGARVDTLILNGAECEPYLTSDLRLMLEDPVAIVEGALAMARLIGVKRVLVGIEADKMPAVESLRAAAKEVPLGEQTFDVVPCEVRYPQGAERQLVTALTGRVIPPRSLPSAVGVLVHPLRHAPQGNPDAFAHSASAPVSASSRSRISSTRSPANRRSTVARRAVTDPSPAGSAKAPRMASTGTLLHSASSSSGNRSERT